MGVHRRGVGWRCSSGKWGSGGGVLEEEEVGGGPGRKGWAEDWKEEAEAGVRESVTMPLAESVSQSERTTGSSPYIFIQCEERFSVRVR